MQLVDENDDLVIYGTEFFLDAGSSVEFEHLVKSLSYHREQL
jgi:hypothetical protein